MMYVYVCLVAKYELKFPEKLKQLQLSLANSEDYGPKMHFIFTKQTLVIFTGKD